MKTVFYQTTSSSQRCNFDLTIEAVNQNSSSSRLTCLSAHLSVWTLSNFLFSSSDPSSHLVACVK